MWYRQAIKYNIFNKPISGDFFVKQFAEEIDTDSDDDQIENIVRTIEDPEIEDNTPEDEFTTEDLETNVDLIDTDPTAMMQLPPLHMNCRCYVETLPILSEPGVNDGRRIWRRSEQCCPKCEQSARSFNEAELIRLQNLGIDVNPIA